MSQPTRNPTWKASRRGCILLLLAFCVGYPLWAIGVELAAREWYFRPLCRSYAAQHGMDLIDYARGGRSSPAACTLAGATIPIAEIAGTTATVIAIGVDALAALGPFLVLLILASRWSAQDRWRRRPG